MFLCVSDSGTDVYTMAAFSKMNIFRKHGQLCDVVIKVGGREFLAHRVVLAATSDYFDAMFSNGMAESAQLEVELKSISPDVMDALLDYVYTGQVHVTMENVQDLLPAASLVQMEGVKTACSDFLLAEVDASNVLGIRRFAELHNCRKLEKFARNYAAHNFELVVEFEEFLCLNHEELLDLIVREDLHIDCEESVYKAVMRWVYHQIPERAPYLPALLLNIRLPVMSVRFLTDVVDKDALIRQSLECRDLVDDAKRFHLRPDLRHEMRERRYRQRDSGDEYLVVIGGFGSDQNPSDSVEMFNPRTLEWSELPDLPISYRYVAACSLDTCVYVIGGFDGRERLNTVCLLDIAHRDEGWRWLTPMHYKRGLSAACTHKGLIYVCGGFDGQSRLRSLEVYHPKIDEWRILEDMTTAREGAGLVVVDDTLYCLGGYDGFHLLNSMEAFDLRCGTWSVCKPMYMRRSGAGCALLGDTVYVCGGYGGAEGRGPLHLDTVEAYNTRLQQWTLVTSMNVPRCYVGACPLGGKIYVAAGYNGSRLLDTVESYDPVENVWWLHDDSRMHHERCDTGMCVVRFLSCAEPPVSVQTSTSSPSSSRNPPAISARQVGQISTQPSTLNVAMVQSPNLLSTGQAMNIRPPVDSINFRVPTLPVAPHLRGGLASFFQPSATLHHSTSFETSATPGHSAVANPHAGLPSSTTAGVVATRGPATRNSLPTTSLRRHPNLPSSRGPASQPSIPLSRFPPGFLPSAREISNRWSSSHQPRSTRQLLAVSGVTQGTTNRDISSLRSSGLPVTMSSQTDMLPSFLPDPLVVRGTMSDEFTRPSHGDADNTEANLHSPPLRYPTDFMTGYRYESNIEPSSDDVLGSIRYEEPGTLLLPLPSFPDSSHNRVSGSLNIDAAAGDEEEEEENITSRASSSSSPTFVTRMYHSAPERGSSPPRHSDLFRSAQQLNLIPQSWQNRGVLILTSDHLTEEISSSYLSRLHPFQANSNREQLFSDAPPTIPNDSLFNCLQLNENLVEDQVPDLFSDDSSEDDNSVLHSPTTSAPLTVCMTGLNLEDRVAVVISSDRITDQPPPFEIPHPDDDDSHPHATAAMPSQISDSPGFETASLLTRPGRSSPSMSTSRGHFAAGDSSWLLSLDGSGSRHKSKPAAAHLTMGDPHWSRRSSGEGRRRRPAVQFFGFPSGSSSSRGQKRDPSDLNATSTRGTISPKPDILECSNTVLAGNPSTTEPVTSSSQVSDGSSSNASDLLSTQSPMELVDDTAGDLSHEPSSSAGHPGSHDEPFRIPAGSVDPDNAVELHSNPESRSDGEGEENQEEDTVTGQRNPAVGQVDDDS
ncbi:BTB/POZ domain protein [Paragonimus heterotremus]|uniref:BTB/POZ domain protein n=1 Tax=Paragonimus heterotremus TaxID=100268 RepID=A0A8J4TJ38_9TREM|nr:BTB/POZ domain protein [Paragonimus heterotremus]